MMQAEETQGHFRMSDGFNLFYRCWTSQRKAEKTVVCIHGGGDHSGWFRVVGPELAVNGTEVSALDLRGFGGSKEEGFLRGDPSDFNRHLQDLDEVVTRLRNQFGWKIYMLGYSLGGSYAIWYAARHPDSLDGLILVAPAIVVEDFDAWAILLLFFSRLFVPRRMYEPMKPSRWAKRLRAQCRTPEEVKLLLEDPLATWRLSIRYIANIKKILVDQALENAKHIMKPVLIIQGEADERTLHIGAERLYRSLGAEGKTLQAFPDANHWLYDTFIPTEPSLHSDGAKRGHLISIVKDWLRNH